MKGSQHNDLFLPTSGVKYSDKEEDKIDFEPVKLHTKTNNAGGTLGGITSGENIVFP
jgi:chorismate synthase